MSAEAIERLISIYGIGFYVCIGITALGLAIAVISFFRFNIWQIYLIRSGRAERETVRRLSEKNLRTGKLSDDLNLDFNTGTLLEDAPTGETGSAEAIAERGVRSGRNGRTGRTGRSGRFGKSGRTGKERAAENHSGETGIFREAGPIDMPEAQHAAWEASQESADTDVLGNGQMTETLARQEQDIRAHEITTESSVNQRFQFSVIEHIMVIHTSESIDS